MNIKRCLVVLLMFLSVSALVASQFVSVDLVHAALPRARPDYPLFSVSPPFTSHLISYPTAHSSSASITTPTNAYDASIGTKAVFSHAVEGGTEYYALEGFDGTVLQDPVSKVDINVRFSTAATSTATLAIAYHPGVWTLRPSGAGTYTGWATVTGAATHWEAVDDVEADDGTTEISDSTNGNTDTFALPDGVVPSGVSISGVTVHVRVYAGGTGRVFQIGVRTHGTDYWSPTITVAKVSGGWIWTPYSYTWSTNPNTASAWTLTEIDALEIGVKNAANKLIHVTQVYAEVESGSYTDLLPATTAAQALNTYTWKDKSVTKVDGLKIKFEIIEADPVETKTVDVYEVWVVQRIDPSTSFPTPTPNYDAFIAGTTFSINLSVSSISATDYPDGFGGYNFNLWYNTTVLSYTGRTLLTTWMPTQKVWFEDSADFPPEELGRVVIVATLAQSPPSPVYGSGDVVSLHFSVDQAGASAFWMNETELGTWHVPAGLIPSEVYDGHYSYRAFDPSTDPVAAFDFLPSSPLVDQDITFNASDSYSTSPWTWAYPYGEESGYLRYYTWDFDDTNITTVESTETIVHNYSAAATYTVNLTVTDRYGLTSSIQHDVTVSEAVPEFPLGTPLYIALAAVIVYVWWRSRPKTNTMRTRGK